MKSSNDKDLTFPCNSIECVRENAVGILGMMTNPNLITKKDVQEIEMMAMEIYDYCQRVMDNNEPIRKRRRNRKSN